MSWYRFETLGHVEDEENAFIDADPTAGERPVKMGPLLFGRSAAASWPAEATLTISPRYGRRLGDLVGTANNVLIVSRRFSALAEIHRQPADAWEFLPTKIIDNRGRIVSSEHGILSPIGVVTCLDLTASTLFRDVDDPDRVLEVEVPVLDSRLLTEPRTLFRIDGAPMQYVVSGVLVDALRAAQLENVRVEPLEVR